MTRRARASFLTSGAVLGALVLSFNPRPAAAQAPLVITNGSRVAVDVYLIRTQSSPADFLGRVLPGRVGEFRNGQGLWGAGFIHFVPIGDGNVWDIPFDRGSPIYPAPEPFAILVRDENLGLLTPPSGRFHTLVVQNNSQVAVDVQLTLPPTQPPRGSPILGRVQPGETKAFPAALDRYGVHVIQLQPWRAGSSIEQRFEIPCCATEDRPQRFTVSNADLGIQEAPPRAPTCGDIPGVWTWFVGGDLYFKPDGNVAQVQGSLTARWDCHGSYITLRWSHNFTDSLEIQAGPSLVGRGWRTSDRALEHPVSGSWVRPLPP